MADSQVQWVLDQEANEYYYIFFAQEQGYWARAYQSGRTARHDDEPRYSPADQTHVSIASYDASAYHPATSLSYTHAAQAQHSNHGYDQNTHFGSVQAQQPNIATLWDGHTLTRVQQGPAEAITDPEVFKYGLQAQTKILTSESQTETLDPGYKLQSHKFFVVGRVIKIFWSEPAGNNSSAQSAVTTRFGERVHSKIRYFVIVRTSHDSCTCLPIQTHKGRGVIAPTARPEQYAVVYTSESPPDILPGEVQAGGERMSRPIKVIPHRPIDKLDPRSRLNYSKIYTVEYNVKVYNFGKVEKDYQPYLEHGFLTALQVASQAPSVTPEQWYAQNNASNA